MLPISAVAPLTSTAKGISQGTGYPFSREMLKKGVVFEVTIEKGGGRTCHLQTRHFSHTDPVTEIPSIRTWAKSGCLPAFCGIRGPVSCKTVKGRRFRGAGGFCTPTASGGKCVENTVGRGDGFADIGHLKYSPFWRTKIW